MEQYIPKADVVAELKRRISNLEKLGNRLYIQTNFPEQYRLIHGYESVISYLDTFKVKEVDLEKEIQDSIDNEWVDEWSGDCGNYIRRSSGTAPMTLENVKEIARYFFELGMRVSKKG